jgi:formylglycine-generating enzyme required for sulfatase activity
MTDCRSSDGGESCCTSLDVKGGSYDRTYTNTGDGGTATADLATVSAFRLDKYEVTVGRFAAFVTAWNQGCGWKPAAGSGKHTHLHGGRGLQNGSGAGSYEPGWLASDDARVDPTSGHLNCNTNYATSPTQGITLPINCVSWWEAYAFCIWDGGFLPSEAEWEYAAAGGSQLLEYPWGNTPPGTSNLYAIYGCDYPMAGNNCTGTAFIAPVGTAEAGAGAFGQVDLMGSVAEWTLDTYARYVVPCDDCAHLEPASSRVVRGGSFESPLSMLSPTDRDLELPAKRRFAIGFRCARAP